MAACAYDTQGDMKQAAWIGATETGVDVGLAADFQARHKLAKVPGNA